MAAIIGKDLNICAEILKKGGTVSIPTETVYGLAANGYDADAVGRIFEIKKRPFFDPLILHLDALDKLENIVSRIPKEAEILMNQYWPGPLTLVLPKSPKVPDIVTSGLDTVGVRIPNHPLTLKLLNMLEFPLAAPSANPFKYISPTKSSHVFDQLGTQIEYILEGGECSVGVESTIIGFENDKPILYRYGGIEIEEIEDLIGDVLLATDTDKRFNAPGMLKLHYSPTKKLIVSDFHDEKVFKTDLRLGIISFKDDFSQYGQNIILAPNGNLRTAANRLFSAMRTLDSYPIDLIIAEKFPEIGLGKAINDRLTRAAAK